MSLTTTSTNLEQAEDMQNPPPTTDLTNNDIALLDSSLPIHPNPHTFLQRSLSDSPATFSTHSALTTTISSPNIPHNPSSEQPLSSEEDDVTSLKGTDIKDLDPHITAPTHLTPAEKQRFDELAKYCPTALMNRDCVHFEKCGLIQPCRKFSPSRWANFCLHGPTRCHNSHFTQHTCRSVLRGLPCKNEFCDRSHDKVVRAAIEGFRGAHEGGLYGVE